MEDLQEEYEHILEMLDEIKEKISALEGSDIIRRYLSLCNERDRLIQTEKRMSRQVKYDQFETCNHIWVTSLINYDPAEDTTEKYEACIKCGLDQAAFESLYQSSQDSSIMVDFMTDNDYNKGIHSNEICDIKLAKAIYSRIKETHPDIDDETARKYFEIALNDIRNIKVSEKRKINRAKRLSLGKFNNWHVKDVYFD